MYVNFLFFHFALLDPVESKLNEYVGKVGSEESLQKYALNDAEKSDLNAILTTIKNKGGYHSSTFTTSQYVLLNKLIQFPLDMIGPVLNLFRIVVSHPHAAESYAKQITDNKGDIIQGLCRIATSTDKHVNAMLAVRTIVNMFSRRVLTRAIANRYEEIVS